MPHVINSRALTGEKPCINKAIHALLMHGYATFNMIVPGPQICCRYEMCTSIISIVHILLPETNNCPSWISGRERMTIENISWSVSTKECCQSRRGLNPRPGLQSDSASNWAWSGGAKLLCILHLPRDLASVNPCPAEPGYILPL